MLSIRIHRLWLLAAFFLGGLSPAAHAARPMMIDDARIVDTKAAQVETWVNRYRGRSEFWAYPAFTFTDNLEITLGGARTWEDRRFQTTDQVVQFKTLFKTLEPNHWAWGLVMGNMRHPSVRASENPSEWMAYIPASVSFLDDRFVLHTNLGWMREKAGRKNLTTWGLGSETALSKRSWLVAEMFGNDREKPFYQLGLRYWIIPNHFQIDTTYGNRFSGNSQERWFSIGIRLLSLPFLP